MSETRCWAEPELRAALDRYETELKAAGKARSTVAAHVGGPERFLDWLARADCTETTGGPSATHDQSEVNDMRSSLITWRSAYRPLYHHLAAQTAAIFAHELRRDRKGARAKTAGVGPGFPPWWENEESGTHTHARAWRAAGYRTRNVDFNRETVEFVRG